MSDELKVCPFCRGVAVGIAAEGHPVHTIRMRCGACGASGPGSASRTGSGMVCDPAGDEAIAAWNRRVATREQVEAAAKRHYLPTEWERLDEGNRSLCIGEAEAVFRAAGFEVAE